MIPVSFADLTFACLTVLAVLGCSEESATDEDGGSTAAATGGDSGGGAGEGSNGGDATTTSSGGSPAWGGASPGEDAGGGEGGGSSWGCPLEGTWSLDSIQCDTIDITVDWKQRVPTTVVVILTADTSCSATVSNEGPTCREVETQSITEAASDSWTIKGLGIQECDPSNCTFDENDDPCLIGDRQYTATGSYLVENGKLITVVSNENDICGAYGLSPTRTTWSPL